MSDLTPIPNLPAVSPYGSALFDISVKPATPDLIQIDEDAVPITIVEKLLFEQIGGIEIINIARSDLINGQRLSYNLIGNTSVIQNMFNSSNMFKLSGTSKEFFENFGIRFVTHFPANGTAPAPEYIDVEASSPGSIVVNNRVTGALVDTFTTYQEAVDYIEATYPIRDVVYIDPNTGNLVVDVTGMKKNETVDIEVLTAGDLEDDTIY